jgi:hypothetical protein
MLLLCTVLLCCTLALVGGEIGYIRRVLERASLRDQFAMHALTALGGHKAVTARGIPWLVEHAYMVADAMLKQRASEPKAQP